MTGKDARRQIEWISRIPWVKLTTKTLREAATVVKIKKVKSQCGQSWKVAAASEEKYQTRNL